MFSHIMVGTNDIEASRKFYDAVLGALGIDPGFLDPKGRYFYMSDGGVFAISKPIDGEAATHANGGTVAFNVTGPEMGDKWHAAGLANGGTTCEEAPGIRDYGDMNMYLAYLRDPSGNKICAIHRME